VIEYEDFDGMDKAELLTAIEEAFPGVCLPETASREDLIRYLRGLKPTDPGDAPDDDRAAGVRSPRPRPPVRGLGAEAQSEKSVGS
jgi:hypothetical protein